MNIIRENCLDSKAGQWSWIVIWLLHVDYKCVIDKICLLAVYRIVQIKNNISVYLFLGFCALLPRSTYFLGRYQSHTA